MGRKPYVGVTGFTACEQVEEVLKVFPKLTGKTMGDWEQLPVMLMAGVLVSSKTMRGGINRWPERYPEIGKVEEIIPHDPRVLGLIHFNTDAEDIASELKDLFDILGYPKNIDGVQLNVPWPEPAEVREFWHQYFRDSGDHEPYIVLQVGEDAFAMTNHDPTTLSVWLHDYQGIVDYVLLDPSGGEGKRFDPFELYPYIKEIRARGINIDIGVAGGLSDICYSHCLPILEQFPETSVDAQGGLRDKATDRLDLDRAVQYAQTMVNRYIPLEQRVPAI